MAENSKQTEKSRDRQKNRNRDRQKNRDRWKNGDMDMNRNTGHQNVHRQIRKLGKSKIVPLTESSRHYTVENKVDN